MPALRRLSRVGLLLLGLVAAGELGHQAFARWGDVLAHHAFHLLFGFGAFIVFAVYAALDIRRHGWPGFSWRLHPRPRADADPPA